MTCIAAVAAAGLLFSGCSLILDDEQQDCLAIVAMIPEISTSISNLNDPQAVRESLTELTASLDDKTSSFPELVSSMNELLEALPTDLTAASPEDVAAADAAQQKLVAEATKVQETCTAFLKAE